MLNQSLRGMFKGEFTEVILIYVESSLPKHSNVTVVDVRNNTNYSDVDCVVLLDTKEHCKEIEKNIANGYYVVGRKRNDNGLKPTVMPVLASDYKACDEDMKYDIRSDV